MAEVIGLDELMQAMQRTDMGYVEQRKLVVKSLRGAARPIEQEYSGRIPVLSGAAKASINTSVVDQTATGAEAQIGPRKFYPKFGEYGTSQQTAKPALGPSFDAREEEALEIMGKILGDGIEDSFYG